MAHKLGTVTLATIGPLDDECLSEPSLRVCDIGHVAIAWSDWDVPCCPLCGRIGSLSGVVYEALERATSEIQEAADEQVTEAEADHTRLRGKAKEARDLLVRALGSENSDLVAAAHKVLDNAL